MREDGCRTFAALNSYAQVRTQWSVIEDHKSPILPHCSRLQLIVIDWSDYIHSSAEVSVARNEKHRSDLFSSSSSLVSFHIRPKEDFRKHSSAGTCSSCSATRSSAATTPTLRCIRIGRPLRVLQTRMLPLTLSLLSALSSH